MADLDHQEIVVDQVVQVRQEVAYQVSTPILLQEFVASSLECQVELVVEEVAEVLLEDVQVQVVPNEL